jgi:hypothetical protein
MTESRNDFPRRIALRGWRNSNIRESSECIATKEIARIGPCFLPCVSRHWRACRMVRSSMHHSTVRPVRRTPLTSPAYVLATYARSSFASPLAERIRLNGAVWQLLSLRSGKSAWLRIAKHRCHQCCPAGLVAGSNAPAGVSVEVFIEQGHGFPVGIVGVA